MCLIYFATNRKPNRKVNTTDFGKVFSEDGIANLRFGRAEFIEDNPFRLQLEPEKLVPDDRDFGIDHKNQTLEVNVYFQNYVKKCKSRIKTPSFHSRLQRQF